MRSDWLCKESGKMSFKEENEQVQRPRGGGVFDVMWETENLCGLKVISKGEE